MTINLIAKNTLILTLAEVVIKGIALIFNFILARLLTVNSFGSYNLILAFVAIFSFLPDLGVNLIAQRDLAFKPKKYPRLIGQTLIVNLSFSLITFITILALFPVYFRNQSLLNLIFLTAMTLVLTSLRTVAKLGFDASQKMSISASFTVINSLFSVLGSLIGFLFTHNIFGLFVGNLIATFLSLVLEWGIALHFFPLPRISFHLSPLILFLKQGLPLSLAAATAIIATKLDILILGRLLTSLQVGWYVAATSLIFAAIQLFNVPLMVAAYPALGKIRTSPSQFKRIIYQLLLLILLWTILFVIFAQLFAQPILTFSFGRPYLPASASFRLLSLIVPFASLSALLYKILIILNRQQLYFWISLFGVIINLSFNLILIPKMGINGAAITAVITQLSLFLIYGYQVRSLLAKL